MSLNGVKIRASGYQVLSFRFESGPGSLIAWELEIEASELILQVEGSSRRL